MYRPPPANPHNNIVRSIKSKFENINDTNNKQAPSRQITQISDTNNKQVLPRQISDTNNKQALSGQITQISDTNNKQVLPRQITQISDTNNKQVLSRQISDTNNKQVLPRQITQISDTNNKQDLSRQISDTNNKQVLSRQISDTNNKQVLSRQISDTNNKQDLSRQISDTNNKQALSRQITQISDTDDKQVLSRQISDSSTCSSSRRNIKRTPAFRVEKSLDRSCDSQREFENKVRQYRDNCESGDKKLIKSKSSHDFEHIRKRFDGGTELYTEPIPKALRNKSFTDKSRSETVYDNSSTIRISDKVSTTTPSPIVLPHLTDTLKMALNKPLPKGPAPKKPPRTFQHSNDVDLKKNISFLHVNNNNVTSKVEKKSHKKADPKYMLDKLESALRNNKLRTRKQPKVDISTTSGEDSDDSLLFRSKSTRSLPKPPVEHNVHSAFNLNCLNSCNNNYERIKEPNSLFFVDRKKEEPVYAEPYHYKGSVKRREGSTRSEKSARNSLYYMSSPVLMDECNMEEEKKFGIKPNDDVNPMDLKMNCICRQISAEDSSLSSFTSDSTTPSPMEETNPKIEETTPEPTPKIKNIIECYERNDRRVENRVEDLKNTLRQTLDRSFNKDSDSENNENAENSNKVSDIILKFETYRQRVPKYCTPKINKDTLFYCCLIIEKVRDVAQIKFKYPKFVEIPQNLESLCFPEGDDNPLTSSDSAQVYTLLITDDKGERTFGYCRRVLPEGCTKSLPLAYCILSKYRATRFYKKILLELESRHGIPTKSRDDLISQFYNQKFPKPGESIRISVASIESPRNDKTENKENSTKPEAANLVLTLHPDSRYEDSDVKKLHQLPADVILKIFSSLLLERKVILISSKIGKLSSCIDSLQSILYPFTWHHTFIPILPESLWDIVETPTPLICGVLSRDVMEDRVIENGIVVNLDSRDVEIEEGDEMKILSGSMQKIWKKSIALANKAALSTDYVHSVYLSDAYLQVFILCFKDYKKFFVDGAFQKEEFIKQAKTKGVRRFLNMFTETYMFLAFLDTVRNNPENLVEFDKKIEVYGSEESHVILDKLLEWNR